eukprot:2841864-Pyramimonas_sp.AAC.1
MQLRSSSLALSRAEGCGCRPPCRVSVSAPAVFGELVVLLPVRAVLAPDTAPDAQPHAEETDRASAPAGLPRGDNDRGEKLRRLRVPFPGCQDLGQPVG